MPKLFLGNLPFKASENDIKDWLDQFGVPYDGVQVIMDRITEKSRGFGFVTVPDDAANDAIQAMSAAPLMGRSITVNVARPQTGGRGDRDGAPKRAKTRHG